MSGVGKVVLLAALGAAGWWGWKQGYVAPLLARLGLGGGSVAGGLPPQPQSGSGQAGGLQPSAYAPGENANTWEAVLIRNASDCQPWAWANRQWAASIMKVESGGQLSSARGGAGEIGLYQVKPGTAAQMYSAGYTRYPATEATLGTEAGGVYFGTAYMQYLSGIRSDREWITKAYNGGPGFEGLGADYIAARVQYLAKVGEAFNDLYGQGRAV